MCIRHTHDQSMCKKTKYYQTCIRDTHSQSPSALAEWDAVNRKWANGKKGIKKSQNYKTKTSGAPVNLPICYNGVQHNRVNQTTQKNENPLLNNFPLDTPKHQINDDSLASCTLRWTLIKKLANAPFVCACLCDWKCAILFPCCGLFTSPLLLLCVCVFFFVHYPRQRMV